MCCVYTVHSLGGISTNKISIYNKTKNVAAALALSLSPKCGVEKKERERKQSDDDANGGGGKSRHSRRATVKGSLSPRAQHTATTTERETRMGIDVVAKRGAADKRGYTSCCARCAVDWLRARLLYSYTLIYKRIYPLLFLSSSSYSASPALLPLHCTISNNIAKVYI